MPNEITVIDNQEVSLYRKYSPDQLRAIANTSAPGLSDNEFELFLLTASRLRLDPGLRQIYARKQWSKNGDVIVTIVGIDGYRAIAADSGEHVGTDDAIFEGETKEGYPLKATVTVYRIVNGSRAAFTASARWKEYYPGDGKEGFFWRKMPYGQLGKCAEALALRKTFSRLLAGVYTDVEMDQADNRQEKQSRHEQISAKKSDTKSILNDLEKDPEPKKQDVIYLTDIFKMWNDRGLGDKPTWLKLIAIAGITNKIETQTQVVLKALIEAIDELKKMQSVYGVTPDNPIWKDVIIKTIDEHAHLDEALVDIADKFAEYKNATSEP